MLTKEQLTTLFSSPAVHIPLILFLSIVLALVAQSLLSKVLSRLVKKTKFSFDDALLEVLMRPVGVTIFIAGCFLTLSICDLPQPITTVIERLLATLAIVVWTVGGMGAATVVINAMSAQKHYFQVVQPQTQPLISMMVKFIILGGALYFITSTWAWDISAWLASAGIVGIAVGFAAKDTLANFFSGVFIVADKPYRVNDYIVLSDGAVRGRVTNIGIRSTRILTRDDVEIIVPNAVIGNSMIINESGGPYEKFRVRVDVSVAYGSNIEQVQELLMQIATEEELAEAYPEPRVRFRSMADSALVFQLLVWVEKPELRGRTIHALNCSIYNALNEHGIEIPYPKRDVYVHNS
jgi:small-conductance mechanosensitive channel